MRIARFITLIPVPPMLIAGVSLFAGGCGETQQPLPKNAVSPYEQAKASFDFTKEEFLKRTKSRSGGSVPSTKK
jgi:hypothetical protein